MLIVVGSDDRYALPLAVTLHSALRLMPPTTSPIVLVVNAGISDQSRHRIERVVGRAHPSTDLRWVEPDVDRFSDLRTTSWGSSASYLPLLIPSLASDHPMALYLDSDLLVRVDLTALWNQGKSKGDHALHAVLDYGFHRVGEALKGDACTRLGIDPDAPYFNSGVMLMNLDEWREQRIPEKAFAFARDHPDAMRFTDQDALNAVIQGNWIKLDERWNVLIGSVDRLIELRGGTKEDQQALRKNLLDDPFIVHFSGPQKPWKPGYRKTARRTYLEELKKCGWFDSQAEQRRWLVGRTLRSPFARLRRQMMKSLWPLVVASRNMLSKLRGKSVEPVDD